MTLKKVQLNKIVKNQLPEYVRSDFPLVGEFLSAYYKGQEYQGAPIDLVNNIDSYIKLSECGNITKSTTLTTRIEETDTDILVGNTDGFPDNNGLIKINDEIISYESKTDIRFLNCTRGFSGITSFENPTEPEDLIFSTSTAVPHDEDVVVENLSILFLEEFLRKAKHQLLYGIQRDLDPKLNQSTFIRQSKDFYSTRGTDESFKILFAALFNEKAEVIRPMDRVVSPSNANFKKTRDIIVESVLGDPIDLINKTLFQDSFENISKAYAPVSHVESINVGINTNIFYKISLDNSWNQNDGSTELLYGDFSAHSKSIIVGDVGIAQTFIDVDSTLGFPNSGTLSFVYANGESGIATYSYKTLNQFLGINATSIASSITDKSYIDQDTFAYSAGAGTTDGIRVKIRSVLNNLQIPTNTRYYNEGSKIKIKSLGHIGNNFNQNNWIFNTIQNYDIKELKLIDQLNFTYRLVTKDPNIFRIGDNIRLYDKNGVLLDNQYEVRDAYDSDTVLIRGEGIPQDTTTIVNARRDFSRVDSDIHSDLNRLIANVQNVYVGGDSVLVASNSLPSHGKLKLNPRDQKVKISGKYNNEAEEIILTVGIDHNFYTGDAVYYTPEKGSAIITDWKGDEFYQEWIKSQLFDEGLYFVKRIDDHIVKLAKSLPNIYNNIFVSVNASGGDSIEINDNTIEKYYFHEKKIQPQKLLRKISKPVQDGKVHETPIGYTGILIDGVEVLNYKSRDTVYAGQLDAIEVNKGGQNYDVINPPLLGINDSVGSGATGYVAVEGSFQEIRVLDSGFDFIDVPIVKITGGNGEGATAEAKIITAEHEVTFDATGVSTSIQIGIDTSIIGFTTYHKFRTGERIEYKTFGKKALAGLNTGATYYVGVVDNKNVKLYTSFDGSVAGVGTTGFNDYGEGYHSLKSLKGKAVVGTIQVTNPGTGYENKQRTLQPVGVDTALNIIHIHDHGYRDQEIVQYSSDGNVIEGLSTSLDYYVKVINKDSFKLANVGVGTTVKDFYYRTEQWSNFRSIGVGTHSFNYPPISVTVTGSVGISSIEGDTFQCIAQPIVRGQITSIHLTENGVGYGASEVLNFERNPDITLNQGRGVYLSPVVHNGSIVDVSVSLGGTDYNTPPNIVVSGLGTGAELVPEMNAQGNIVSVKVNKGGIGYGVSTTTVRAEVAGKKASFRPLVQQWRVNNFKRNFANLLNDDIFIDRPTNRAFDLQCSYAYAPRSLRKILYTSGSDGDILYGKKDLTLKNNQEIGQDKHSPIIGWAYDGHPIYGPYGYTTRTGGTITQMKSGYTENATARVNRPPTTVFPEEFFVEDFKWSYSTDDGILDENNGRFCVTPEYPNGTYAYFSTFEADVEGTGPFVDFKKPAFPYLIGENFNAAPEKFNYERLSNQDDINLNDTDWIRNTFPYALDKDNSGYDYVQESYTYSTQDSIIKSTEKSGIDAVGIVTGGTKYQVGDKVVFEQNTPHNFSAAARVSKVAGAGIATISINAVQLDDVELYPSGAKGEFIGIATTSHGIINNTVLTISGLSTTSSKLEGSYNVGITTNQLSLTVGIATEAVTGIVTYLSVNGNLTYPAIKENDRLRLSGILTTGNFGDEEVKVLNVDRLNSRIRVLRDLKAQTGLSHTATTVIKDIPRKFYFYTGITTTYSPKLNTEYYFYPGESVGLGTATPIGIAGTVVGSGSTITFENPGAGITTIFVESQSIYLPNHKLQTGDEVTYHTNTGTSIGIITAANNVAIGTEIALNLYPSLYVARIDRDHIGVSSVKVGMGSTGMFVGAATSTAHTGLVYFAGVGTGVYHSFKTQSYTDIIKGSIEQNRVTVATASTHGLSHNNTVDITVNPRNTGITTVQYNKPNRKVVTRGLGFTASGVTSTTSLTGTPDSISIINHGLITGQKVIHKSETPAGGLVHEKEYFVYVIDRNKIKLCLDKYESQKSIPTFVGIHTANVGTLCEVNPTLNFYRDSNITFDLSDSSLSYTRGSEQYPAFELEFYRDASYTDKYETNATSRQFDIVRTGTVGVTADAKLTLAVNKDTPDVFYYKLTPVDKIENPQVYKDLVIDDIIDGYNQVNIKESDYAGKFNILLESENTFTYNLGKYPESDSYSGSTSQLEYDTNSTSAYGRITDIQIISTGSGYPEVPGITTVTSDTGSGFILEASSKTIGRINKSRIENIGFDYPTDKTLRPAVAFPQILKIEALTGFDFVGVTSLGRGYNTAPSLVVVDNRTKKQITDVDLRYHLGVSGAHVEILENTNSLFNTTPTILPTGNPNGIKMKEFSYNTNTQVVTATYKNPVSRVEDFTLEVGDRIMVENVSVGVGSTGLGYNSINYDYNLFTITGVSTNLGAFPTITYSMADFLNKDANQLPGRFQSVTSGAIVTPEKYFPQFDSILASNQFNPAEGVTNGTAVGNVFKWDPETGELVVESNRDFEVGTIIESKETGSKGKIVSKLSTDSIYDLDYYSIVENGWEYTTGFLNDELQRIHDNEYYQNFSYAIKSRVTFDDWKDVVSSLNHAAGFKKFSDLQLESIQDDPNGLEIGVDSETEVVVDFQGYESLHSVETFDLATENYLVGDKTFSDEINFENRILTDYAQSVGNRVLNVDDISGDFDDNARTSRYADVFRQSTKDGRSQKIVAYVRDRLYGGERQLMIINALHDIDRGFSMINQYGDVSTVEDLGSYDYVYEGGETILRYFPTKFEINNYNIRTFSYNLDKNVLGIETSVASIGSTTIGISTDFTGSLVSIASTNVQIAGGAADEIYRFVGVGTNISGTRSAKILVTAETDTGRVEYDEVSLISDGTNVSWQEFGQLTIHSYLDPYSSAGNIGTFFSYMNGEDIVLKYTPDAGFTTTRVNAIAVAFSTERYKNESQSDYEFQYGSMQVQSKFMEAAADPDAVGIASYADDYDAAYFIVQASDMATNSHCLTEGIIVDDYADNGNDTVYMTQYGEIHVGAAFTDLGTIDGRRGSGDRTEITYRPASGRDIDVKIFMNTLRVDENTNVSPGGREVGGDILKEFNNATIETNGATYEGTENTVKKQFNLTYKTDDIFRRNFDGSSETTVNVSNNTLEIPNHFFVTGEELKYSVKTGFTTDTISIANTSFAGIGSTTRMPSSVFVIKQSENIIKLARSAEDALKSNPVELDITSVGIGTSHSFTSTNQNQKVLMLIDNMIQSPIAGTSVTTTLADSAALAQDVIKFTGISSFAGADYIQVGSGNTIECMKILSVGIGSTNQIKVRRGWLGTPEAGFGTGALVQKIRGHYNIVENDIHFIEPPHGAQPFGTSTNPPDQRDYLGITTSSSFQGRVFMRSGVENTASETYTSNYLYDDISNKFTGYDKEFPLTVDKQAITGVSTNNAIIIINGVFQGPGANNNYTMSEVGGGTSISFTGSASSVGFDPNNANIPVGGVIVSVSSTDGFGYQPLVSAGGTVTVSAAGTISNITIGNTGSGYRVGIQTVNVAIQTSSNLDAQSFLDRSSFIGMGTAQITDGNITGIAITNTGIIYTPRDISNAGYSSVTGITTITTTKPHGLVVGDDIRISGLAFTCEYAKSMSISTASFGHTSGIMTVSVGLNTVGVTTFSYDNVVGVGTVTLSEPHKIAHATGVGRSFTLALLNVGIARSGVDYGSTTWPNSDTATGDTFQILSVPSPTELAFTAGISTLTHTYTSGGHLGFGHKMKVGDTTILTGLAFTGHSGLTTDYYPHGKDAAYDTSVEITNDGTTHTVTNASYNPTTGVLTLTVPSHGFSNGDKIRLVDSSLTFTCSQNNHKTQHEYPRATDPSSGEWLTISNKTTNTFRVNVLTNTPASNTSTYTFVSAIADGLIHQGATVTVNVGSAGDNDSYTHTFVSAATSAIVSGGNYSHNFAYAIKGGVRSGGNYLHTFASAVAGGVDASGVGTMTPTDASYDPTTGDLVLTIANHGLNTGNTVSIATSAITFTCSMDQHNTDHAYPRATDPVAGIQTAVTGFTTSTFTINVGTSPIVTHNVTNAVYTPTTGALVLTLDDTHGLLTGKSVRIVDESLFFTCDMDGNSSYHPYPRSTDPVSYNAVSIASTTTTTITLNVGVTTTVYYNVAVGSGSSATSYNASTGDLVLNVGMGHSLRKGRSIKIATDSLSFKCTKDGNATNHTYPRVPTDNYRGMEVVGIGTTVTELSISAGIATLAKYYQGGGVIQEALITPRGTDAGAGGMTILTVIDTKSFTVNSGKSEYHHLYARGGSVTRKMDVVIDDPLSYTDIPLAYSSISPGIGGLQATADIVVSMGSTIIDFEIKNTGYGYNVGHILTLPITGAIGIPTTSSANFNEFKLEILEADYDVFTGWSIGQLQVLDNFASLFDGVRKTFPITLDGEVLSIQAKRGSLISIQDTILVFINDILQVPGKGYEFSGGSQISFTEAPKGPSNDGLYDGDTMKFLFYKGTGGGDVIDVDVIETVKKGDDLRLEYDSRVNAGLYGLQEDTRTVSQVTSTNSVDTNIYFGPGLTEDGSLTRSVTWTRQLEDKYIDGKIIGKDRELYDANIFPYAHLIQPVGVGTTIAYVDNLRPIFDPQNESQVSTNFQKSVTIVSQADKLGAAATSFVGGGSTVISVAISTGGRGYTSAPQVTIQNPVGLGTTAKAEATASITDGVVTSITITNDGGVGYSQTTHPYVLISPPTYTRENNSVDSYNGDSGVIVGFGTTSTSSGPELVFDLFIPEDSNLRDAAITGTAVTQCGITTSDYFTVFNSNVGVADTGAGIGVTPFTSKSIDDRVIGFSTQFVDAIFQVGSADIIERHVLGIGMTSVTRIHTSVLTGIGTENLDSVGITMDTTSLTFDNEASGNVYAGTISTTTNGQAYFGNYSWGKIVLGPRIASNSYTYYGQQGFAGISTGDMIFRRPKLKTVGYST